jgi:hypothetical protein
LNKTRSQSKITTQNPDNYFHQNICKKFNIKGKPRKGIDMGELENANNEAERMLLTSKMTGHQKRQ